MKNQKTDIIPGSGVDTHHFYFDKNKTNSEIINFLFIGSLIKDKGIIELIEAFETIQKTNKNVCLLLVGSLDKNNLSFITESKVKDWKTNKIFHFLGYIEDIREKIVESDCVILPSYREGLPKVLLEAASIGRALVATNVPGCREIVRNGVNGFLVQVKESKCLAEAIQKLILNKELRTQMGLKSREIIEAELSSEIINKQFIELYNSTIKLSGTE